MRRFAIIIAAICVAFSVSAQKKPKLGKVESMLLNGDIAGAREMVEQATEYEKTMDNPKTYYLKALIYVALDTATATRGTVDNALETAVAAFQKSEELNEGGKELYLLENGFPALYSSHKENYWGYYFNIAATAYGEEDYATATEYFEYSQLIVPGDTNGYINAGLAAQNAQNLDAAKRNYYKAIELGVKEKSIWNLLIYLVGQDKDFDEAVRLIREAKKIHPNESEFARSEISYLIQAEKIEEAEGNLIAQIEAEPDDPNLYFTLGILNEELSGKAEDEEVKTQRKVSALEAYRKAVEIDPTHYNSQYNIGVMLISQANAVIKERNALGVSRADLKKADELAPLIEERLKVALPQWETIVELNSTEVQALETLSYLYTQLKMMDKAEEVMDKIDALKN